MVEVNTGNAPIWSGPGHATPDRVYEELRQRIISLEYAPGSALDRNAIARGFGVSQTPVRDALQNLSQDGLVVIVPQSKTLVSRIDLQQLFETQFLRVAVEIEVVQRLCETRPEGVIGRTRALIEMQKALAAAGGEVELFSELDQSFHRVLFEGAGVAKLYVLLLKRLGHLYRCQRLHLPRDGKMQIAIQSHSAIIDGIEKGSKQDAAEAMRDHLSGTIGSISTLRKDHPDYFTDGEAL